ncbi:MAG: hypothetical protein GF418_08410 [Chitinivibrionales bacterium]|nr:hypothetical protein [Chitinivibrionales bacterium]MBD3395635.1 hypothetical protein [Chitinivibrionales bacterium]
MYIHIMTSQPGRDREWKNGTSERRHDSYAFTSERDLVNFFSASLPKKTVRKTIASVKADFVQRKLGTSREHKLQFLKKCEVELVRLSRPPDVTS